MAKERFESRSLQGNIKVTCKYDDGTIRFWEEDKAAVVRQIRKIVTEYQGLGYKLTLRQLHYQFVANDKNYVNHDTAYKKLGSILDDCRYAGIIDWDAIEDRGRVPYIPYSADDLADGLTDLKNQFRLNRQEGQTNYVELWTEKDALSGILRRSTSKYHVQLVVNKGYTSSSACYEAYSRIAEKILEGIKVTILYFGDHDPSGLDMIRDITDRLYMMLSQGDKLYNDDGFRDNWQEWLEGERERLAPLDISLLTQMARESFIDDKLINKIVKAYDKNVPLKEMYPDANNQLIYAKIKYYLVKEGWFTVKPIGLTMEQIREYDLPPNPAKVTDPRAANYVREFGKISWEVDALKPEVLSAIVEENIEATIDMEMYDAMVDKEEACIDRLKELIEQEKESDD